MNYYNIIPYTFIALILIVLLYCIVKPVLFDKKETEKEGFSAGNGIRMAAIETYLDNVSTLITEPRDYALIKSNIKDMLNSIKDTNAITDNISQPIFDKFVANIRDNIEKINVLLTDKASKQKLQSGFRQIMDSLENKFVGPPY